MRRKSLVALRWVVCVVVFHFGLGEGQEENLDVTHDLILVLGEGQIEVNLDGLILVGEKEG